MYSVIECLILGMFAIQCYMLCFDFHFTLVCLISMLKCAKSFLVVHILAFNVGFIE